MDMSLQKDRIGPTRRRLLDLLKRSGPQDTAMLARRIGTSDMAVRQHLAELARDGLVAYALSSRGERGRPAKLWHVTEAAGPLFPNRHADLAADLLTDVRQAFGANGLEQLLERRSRRQEEAYRARMKARNSLRTRLERLAEARSEEGYMAEVVAEGRDAFLLIENHCPIANAAHACQGLCRQELEVFRRVLGPRVRVERTEHALEGRRRCVYRVTRAGSSSPSSA